MGRLDRIDPVTGARLSLAYDAEGEGEPIVQLHGLTSSRARDRVLGTDLLSGLGEWRRIRYDARGHGRSTGPRTPAAYAWPRLADDLLALLDQVAPGAAVHGVGQSMGSGTLLYAALREPSRFATLTLAIPPTAWAARRAQRKVYLHGADMIERRGLAYWAALNSRVPLPPAVGPDRPVTLPDVAEDLLPWVYRGAAMTDLPALETLAALQVPTLLLAWVGDPSHPLATAQALAAILPVAHLVVAETPEDADRWPTLLEAHLRSISALGGRRGAGPLAGRSG